RDRACAAGHRLILRAAVSAVYAFLLVPMLVVVVAAFNSGSFFTFPPQGFSLRWFANFFARREFMQALRLSTELALWTAVLSTLTHFDLALEEAAQSLGAHPVRAFLEVTLGVIKPGVVAGAIFAFAISFDNFTLSLFLTSSRLTPLPIELFAYLKYSFDPTAAAVSAVAIGVALVVVLGIARVVGLEEFTGF